MIWVDFELNTLLRLLMPTFLRRMNMVSFMESLVFPLKSLKYETLYKMQHDCRVMWLEKVLNEYFKIFNYDPNDHVNTRVIFITDGEEIEELYIHLEGHPEPTHLGTAFINSDEYYDANHADFIVNVPLYYSIREVELRALIDYYKMAGKAYKIKYFT